jgi:hypothetical protein
MTETLFHRLVLSTGGPLLCVLIPLCIYEYYFGPVVKLADTPALEAGAGDKLATGSSPVGATQEKCPCCRK